MANPHNLNTAFSLGKDKRTGEWKPGQWINQSLYTIDGSNKKICNFKDQQRWRYFRDAEMHISDIELMPGDRVSISLKRGTSDWYYVVYSVKSTDGKFHYLVGF